MSGVLESYRVLEFGDYIASQMFGMLLADQGAEVVKVEPPEGSRLRGRCAVRGVESQQEIRCR